LNSRTKKLCFSALRKSLLIAAKNQKFYAENDARFKDSPLLKKLLENSKLNKEK